MKSPVLLACLASLLFGSACTSPQSNAAPTTLSDAGVDAAPADTCVDLGNAIRSFYAATSTSPTDAESRARLIAEGCVNAASLEGTQATALSASFRCLTAQYRAFAEGKAAPACDPPTGTLADGSPCRNPTQCASGACSFPNNLPKTPAEACGECVPALKVGQECGLFATCPSGAACFGTTCKLWYSSPIGERCYSDAECATNHCQEGKCVDGAWPGPGQACSASNVCAKGSLCNVVERKCKALAFLKPGEACTNMVPAQCEGGTCTDARQCVAYATVGQTCSGMSNPCEPLLKCMSGTCVNTMSVSCQN